MSLNSFQQKILPLKNRMFRYAFSLLNNEEDARDVVQDAFMKIWDKRGQWDEIRSMEAWTTKIIRNLCLDRLKSANFTTREAMPELEHKIGTTSEIPLEGQQMIEIVHSLINKLPQLQKEVLVLRDQEGLTYQEIGNILNIDMNLVKVSIHRGRKTIKNELNKIMSYGLRKDR